MKFTSELYVYAWVNASGTLNEELEFSSYPKSGESWISVLTTEDGQPAKAMVSCTIPDNWASDWRQKALAKIEQVEADERKILNNRLAELREFKEKLLAISYNPSAGTF